MTGSGRRCADAEADGSARSSSANKTCRFPGALNPPAHWPRESPRSNRMGPGSGGCRLPRRWRNGATASPFCVAPLITVLRTSDRDGFHAMTVGDGSINKELSETSEADLLRGEGIGLPVTAFAHGPRKAVEVIMYVGGVPVVIMLL